MVQQRLLAIGVGVSYAHYLFYFFDELRWLFDNVWALYDLRSGLCEITWHCSINSSRISLHIPCGLGGLVGSGRAVKKMFGLLVHLAHTWRGCKSALNPKAVAPVLVLLFVALWFILRGDLF